MNDNKFNGYSGKSYSEYEKELKEIFNKETFGIDYDLYDLSEPSFISKEDLDKVIKFLTGPNAQVNIFVAQTRIERFKDVYLMKYGSIVYGLILDIIHKEGVNMNNVSDISNVPQFTEEEIEKIRKQAEEKYNNLILPERMACKVARLIILQFEDFLNFRCVELPNPYKSDDRLHETPCITNIYGDDYDDLVDSVARILLRFCDRIGIDNYSKKPPVYKGYVDFGEETEYPYFGFTQEQMYHNPAYLEDLFECTLSKDLWFHIKDESNIHFDNPGYTWRDMQELYRHVEEMKKSKESESSDKNE